MLAHNYVPTYTLLQVTSRDDTGCKNMSTLTRLAHYNYVTQTMPDVMHTVKDAVETLLKGCVLLQCPVSHIWTHDQPQCVSFLLGKNNAKINRAEATLPSWRCWSRRLWYSLVACRRPVEKCSWASPECTCACLPGLQPIIFVLSLLPVEVSWLEAVILLDTHIQKGSNCISNLQILDRYPQYFEVLSEGYARRQPGGDIVHAFGCNSRLHGWITPAINSWQPPAENGYGPCITGARRPYISSST